MKILLAACNAKYIHSNPAVYDLKAYAAAYKDSVQIKEFTINQPKDEIMKEIYRSGADVVCFSCYIWNISFVRELIRDLKKILPDTAFWAGGPEVSFHAKNFLEDMPQVTGIMKGEGEETFLALAGYYLEGKGRLEEISGIVFRKENEIVDNGFREPVDLDRIPLSMKIRKILRTGSYTMRAAGDARFPAATVFPPSTGNSGSAVSVW